MWTDHDHRGQYADERHDHWDYADTNHRHYDLEHDDKALSQEVAALREQLHDAVRRIEHLENVAYDGPQQRRELTDAINDW